MKHLLVWIFLLYPLVAYSQHILKLRTKDCDVTMTSIGKPAIWVKTPDAENTLVVYDADKRKFNIYSSKQQDLSIIRSEEVTNIKMEEGLHMFSMSCIDQDNIECEVTLFVKNRSDSSIYRSMLIRYSYATYRFILEPD